MVVILSSAWIPQRLLHKGMLNHLLYFLPDVVGIPRAARQAWLAQRGLPHLEDCSLPFAELMKGPSEGRGLIFPAVNSGDKVDPRLRSFLPDEQIWKRYGSDIWIGRFKDAQIGPSELRRPMQVKGHRVKLCDGNQWLIPLVRSFDGATCLPQTIDFDEDGQPVLDIQPKYSKFYSQGIKVWDRIMEDDLLSPTEVLLDLAVEALKVNYSVSKWEIGFLGLLDTQIVQKVTEAVIDAPTWRRWVELKKKLTPASSPESDGDRDISQTIDQPVQT